MFSPCCIDSTTVAVADIVHIAVFGRLKAALPRVGNGNAQVVKWFLVVIYNSSVSQTRMRRTLCVHLVSNEILFLYL